LQASDLFKNQGKFLVRLHGLLDFLEKENEQSIVAWTEGGKAFAILDTKTFVNDIFPLCFEPLIWSSFEQQKRSVLRCRASPAPSPRKSRPTPVALQAESQCGRSR
jgi:hypothetical protein